IHSLSCMKEPKTKCSFQTCNSIWLQDALKCKSAYLKAPAVPINAVLKAFVTNKWYKAEWTEKKKVEQHPGPEMFCIGESVFPHTHTYTHTQTHTHTHTNTNTHSHTHTHTHT